jgi:hypothetical protein
MTRGNPYILSSPARKSFDKVVTADGQSFPFRLKRLYGLEALAIQDIGNRLVANFVAEPGKEPKRSLPPIGDDVLEITPAACYLVATVLAAQCGDAGDEVWKPWEDVAVIILFHTAYEQMMGLVEEIGAADSEPQGDASSPFDSTKP